MKLKKTQIALGLATATLSMAGALVSPHAVADAKVEALEAQVNQMSEMLQQMQSELSRVRDAASRSAADTAKVQELDEWAASVKANPASAAEKDSSVCCSRRLVSF
jgi:multidrug resistance efflux pump